MSTSTVDAQNLLEFTSRADQWWDLEGPFKPLHALNPTRLAFIKEQICDLTDRDNKDDTACGLLAGLTILDVGCGGGLVTEPLAKGGGTVTGLDAGVENIEAAKQHADQEGLDISYICSALEDYTPPALYDVVLALEIVEHVTCVHTFINNCFRVLKPGGTLILSTLNRTLKSFALGIVGAEYILNWVPKGTHNWQQFLKPSELAHAVRQAGGLPTNLKGFIFQPFSQTWALANDVDVNYFLVSKKPKQEKIDKPL